MKKLAAILMICVLAGSFAIGTAFASGPPAGHLSPKCFLNTKYPMVCDSSTCKAYVTYTCPWGNVLVWDGDYCCDPWGGE
jgi:hypothetical protein